MTTRKMQRCGSCLGMGYKGRWRVQRYGPKWKLETCQRCRGTGEVEVTERRRKAHAR